MPSSHHDYFPTEPPNFSMFSAEKNAVFGPGSNFALFFSMVKNEGYQVIIKKNNSKPLTNRHRNAWSEPKDCGGRGADGEV